MEKIDITKDIDEMSDERHMIAASRAFRQLGIEYQAGLGSNIVVDLGEEGDLDLLLGSELFLSAYEEELKRLVAADTIRSLERKGAIEATGINKDGQINYSLKKTE